MCYPRNQCLKRVFFGDPKEPCEIQSQITLFLEGPWWVYRGTWIKYSIKPYIHFDPSVNILTTKKSDTRHRFHTFPVAMFVPGLHFRETNKPQMVPFAGSKYWWIQGFTAPNLQACHTSWMSDLSRMWLDFTIDIKSLSHMSTGFSDLCRNSRLLQFT